MHLLSAHKVAYSIIDILFSPYILFLPLMLYDILSYSLPILLLLAICTHPESTQPCLRPQLHTPYSNALSDTEFF